ncbi:MAG: MBL fold metallo-hydrolase [Leptospiraceae bacterium]|nr:MBL fold metallo-hydrolase [Leptospiraceae bacterium]
MSKILLFLLIFLSVSIHSEDLYVLRYARSYYPAKYLNGKSETGLKKLSWYLFYIKIKEKKILIDTGVCDEAMVRKFKFKNYRHPLDLLEKIGVKSSEITDIILTHSHFDHIGCIKEFPNANIHIHKDELESLKNTWQFPVYSGFLKSKDQKQKLDSFPDSISLSGLEIKKSGGHTPGSVFVESNHFLITGDECYFVKECLDGIGLREKSRFSEENNLKFLKYLILQKNKKPELTILSLHDPKMLDDFVKISEEIHKKSFPFNQ